MNPQLFMYFLGLFSAMLVFGATGLVFRKWYRSPLEKSIKQQYKEIDSLHIGSIEQQFDLIALKRLAKGTDSGLEALYGIVSAIDKDVKRLKKKAKGKSATVDAKDIVPGKVIKGTELFGGLSTMPCGYETFRKAEIEGDKIKLKIPNGPFISVDIDYVIELCVKHANQYSNIDHKSND